MRSVVFAGPSIFGLEVSSSGLEFRPPSASGDLLTAVCEGVRIIGLIDGLYGDCAAVWHKEILHALSKGVTVAGAASIGALRAAECHPFGMIGVGEIFHAYRDGRRVADADVAVTHAPAELGYRPLTIALVDAEATIAHHAGSFEPAETKALLDAARSIHFTRRTWRSIVALAGLGANHLQVLREGAISSKRQDAALLIDMLGNLDRPSSPPRSWTFQNTMFFQDLLRRSRPPGENH